MWEFGGLGLRFRVEGLGVGLRGLGLRFRVEGLGVGFRGLGLRFRRFRDRV